MNKIITSKQNLGESIRQRLKNLAKQKNRSFDEILRYYAMERFLYRLSILTCQEVLSQRRLNA